MTQLFNQEYEWWTWQNEMDVLLSLLSDRELLELKDKIEVMITDHVYETPRFPLSLGGLRFLQDNVVFAFWCRKGKGIRIEEGGERVVCELEESPFSRRYKEPEVFDEGCIGDVSGGVESRVGPGERREVGEGESKESASEEREGEWV